MTVYTGQIDETVSLAQRESVAAPGTISELLGISQLGDVILGRPATVSETVTITDALTPYFGIEIIEALGITQAEIVNAHFGLTVAELASFKDDLSAAWPVVVAEQISVVTSELVQRAVTVIEALGLVDTVVPTLLYHLSVSEQLVVADTIARFFGADVIEGLTLTAAMNEQAFRTARVDEALSVVDTLTPRFLLRVTCNEDLELTADEAVRMLFNAEVDETIEIVGAYLAPNGSVTTWVMNTRTGGVTEYQNYAFNSFARIGNKYIGAADDGLYELMGDDDDGTDVIATIRSGFAQWSGTHLGSFKAAYLAVAGAGDYVLRVLTRDGKTFNYRVTAASGQSVKVNMGKGLRSRYFAFELVSTGQDFDLDTLEFIPLVKDRRV